MTPDDIQGWLGSLNPTVSKPSFEVSVQLLSEYPRPADYSKHCLWGEMPHRAAADRFLLAELEIYLEARPQFGLVQGGIAELREQDLVAAVEVTAASWPGWRLSGDDNEPVRERLDQHFAPAHAAYLRWIGFKPVERNGRS